MTFLETWVGAVWGLCWCNFLWLTLVEDRFLIFLNFRPQTLEEVPSRRMLRLRGDLKGFLVQSFPGWYRHVTSTQMSHQCENQWFGVPIFLGNLHISIYPAMPRCPTFLCILGLLYRSLWHVLEEENGMHNYDWTMLNLRLIIAMMTTCCLLLSGGPKTHSMKTVTQRSSGFATIFSATAPRLSIFREWPQSCTSKGGGGLGTWCPRWSRFNVGFT